MSNQFKIGVAKDIITPPLGTNLYGYPYERLATKVHDDLRVNAIAVEQGDVKAVIISADICSISYEITDKIRELITTETNVPSLNISISAIHTHSGPATRAAKGWGDANHDFIDNILIPKTVLVAKKALDALVPAVMGVGTTRSNIGVNRREINLNGEADLGQNPHGQYDPTMTVLSFRSTEGDPIVNLIHYSCHPTSAGGGTEITRDWPGVMVDRMEEQTGAVSIFFNGSEGDVGPRLSNGLTIGDMSHVLEIGSIGAIDAVRAYTSIKEYCEVDFRLVTDTIKLPYNPLMSLEDAEARLNELGGLDEIELGVNKREYATLCEIVKIHKSNQPIKTHQEFRQTLFAFNSVVIVPFPFEMFVEIALRLRKHSPFQHTLCTCNTNGSDFYLPSHDQLCRGGYEVAVFKSGSGSGYTLVENTDDKIINENLRIMKKFCI